MQLAKDGKVCLECKEHPVRGNGKHLCFRCFEIALRDLLRIDDQDKEQGSDLS